jgi:hypothetical protein
MPNRANLGAMPGLFAAYDGSQRPSLRSITPNSQSLTVAGDWTIAVVGEFPDPNPSDYRLILHTPDGQELEEGSITNLTATTLDAGFLGGPTGPGARAGESYAELRLESRQLPHGEYGRAPFTWTP